MTAGGPLEGSVARWRNWGGNQRATVTVVRAGSADQIAAVLSAAAASGRRVRPIGSGHSFSGIGCPEDVQLVLDGLTGVRSVTVDGLVTVDAGTPLYRLTAELARRGWALTNLGDIDRQTIAGAIATGTHGTGARFGGLATQVRALDLVTPSGEVLTCAADRHPEVFAAARVGLGALGVVTSVMLQAEPAFALRAEEGPGTLTAALESFEELMTSTDHVEFYWFPHTDVTLVKCNTRVPLAGGLSPLPRWRAVWDDEVLANAAFAGVVAAGRRLPALVPPLARFSARALAPRTWTDHSHRVFVSRRRVRFVETEYAVPRAAAPAVLAELRRAHKASDWRSAFPVEVRLAAADDIPLSTASGRDTAYIAAHVPAGAQPGPWFEAVESIAGQAGGRPHWGKLHGLDATALRERYPRFAEFVALRDRLDPTGVLSNAYLDRVLGPAPPADCSVLAPAGASKCRKVPVQRRNCRTSNVVRGMFPPGAFAVGVSVASIDPGVPDEELPADPEPWPSRLGEQLRLAEMTDVQMAFHLRRLQAVKAEIAAFEAELVVGLAERRPAWADRQAGQPGAASGEWPAAPPTAPISAACAEGTTGSRPTPAAGPTP